MFSKILNKALYAYSQDKDDKERSTRKILGLGSSQEFGPDRLRTTDGHKLGTGRTV